VHQLINKTSDSFTIFYIYYTKQQHVSRIYHGQLQGFASTCTAYMELVIDHCILTTLYIYIYIYVYSVPVITEHLPYTLYTLTKHVAP